jgi:hypothetical protein
MAQISVNFDTASKKLTVNVDGEEIQNVSGVSIYTYENYDEEKKTECSICTHEKSETGVVKTVHYHAHADAQGKDMAKQALANDSSIKGFVGVKEEDVTSDLSKFFGSKSRIR